MEIGVEGGLGVLAEGLWVCSVPPPGREFSRGQVYSPTDGRAAAPVTC